MNYANIKYYDIANGTGVRTSLFVSGCKRHCEACFNPEAWSFEAGKPFTGDTEADLLQSLAPSYIAGLTLLGGDPFEIQNQRALLPFLERVHSEYPQKSIWAYTGFTWEELIGTEDVRAPYTTSPHIEVTERLLSLIDVLVDGPFILAKKDISLRFCGSSNQRLIDVPKTLAELKNPSAAKPSVVLWEDDPIFATHSLA